jgi:Predicted cobalamin binding protein
MEAKARNLINHIAKLDEEEALSLAKTILENGAPGQDVLHYALEGLQLVGQKYENGGCYLSGLVMAGEIMRAIVDLIREISPIQTEGGKASGTIILGTIEGDIHDLGKDLVREVLQSHGFVIHDLGVDVAPEQFLAKSIQIQPDLVAISILIRTCYPALSRAVNQIKTMIPAGFKRPGVIIGGSAVDQVVFEHVKADIWCPDIMDVTTQCREWLKGHNDIPTPKSLPSLVG